MAENIASSVPGVQGSNAARTSWRELSVHNYVKMLIIGGLFVYLFHNEIENLVRRWLTDSSWSHGFLIPLFSLYFINQRKSEILNLPERRVDSERSISKITVINEPESVSRPEGISQNGAPSRSGVRADID